jgi:hypothetical protein
MILYYGVGTSARQLSNILQLYENTSFKPLFTWYKNVKIVVKS